MIYDRVYVLMVWLPREPDLFPKLFQRSLGSRRTFLLLRNFERQPSHDFRLAVSQNGLAD